MRYKATVKPAPRLDDKEWLTLQECAEMFRLSYQTVLRCIKQGDFEGVVAVRIGAQWRVARASLGRILSRRE
ncbi:helix-turn-helix domain-containing protein [Candidatus Saccharibacteria bacterium]|nr:helix-turn-helix domain-containing protein [Candidatus Saccharibacteria bacterium]